MKILGIVPARGGSKGLKRKNIKILHDKPLIAWTICEAKKSKYIDKIIVSTDDKEIKRVSEDYDVEVIDRPYIFATDEASTIDVLLHGINHLANHLNYKPDIIVLLQCTSPLRKSTHIDEAIELLIHHQSSSDSLISVIKEEHPPWWLRKINNSGFLERYFSNTNISRRQDACELYRPNGAIYIIKTDVLLEKKSFQTERTIPYIMDNESSIDIDTELDFMFADFFIKHLHQKGN